MNSELQDILARYPLRRAWERAKLAEGDLAEAAELYAREAEYRGDSEWWSVWARIQQTRGLPKNDWLLRLGPQQLRWLAKWAFGEGSDRELAAEAYERYLHAATERPMEIGPFERENCTYLDYLLAAGAFEKVVETVNLLAIRDDDAVWEEARRARALQRLGRWEEATTRFEVFVHRHHNDGDIRAMYSILLAGHGPTEKSRAELHEAIQLGVDSRDLLEEALGAHGLGRPPGLEMPVLRHTAGTPGALRPTRESSPHVLGGQHFGMPPCAGCGRQIRQWMRLHLPSLPALHALLPRWGEHLPFLGCNQCGVWMGRHDYSFSEDFSQIHLHNAAISVRQYGEPYEDPAGPLPVEPAAIDWSVEAEEQSWERPLVCGPPPWVQQPLTVVCPGCRQGMVYVGAMTTPHEFESKPAVNESGYNFHFACDECRILSVVAQWT